VESSADRRASEIGETALVKRLTDRLGPAPANEIWSGDDAAVIATEGARLLFTVDTLTEGVDFDRAYATGADIGFKALAVNVSDIAAMGGRPSTGVVSLTVPGDTKVGFLDDVMTGLVEGAGRWGVDLVGGDLGGGGEVSISVALLGTPVAEPVLRSGARPGHALCVTGVLGGAAGGLEVLRSRREPSDAERTLIGRHLRPEPRVEEGTILAGSGASAMIDVSDGLAAEVHHLADSSGVGVVVEKVPVAIGVSRVSDDPEGLALGGGEDYELVFTAEDPRRVETVFAEMGLGVPLRIGHCTADPGERRLRDGELPRVGWVHG
jgi:thiamine-monophosphate kinase